MAITLSCEGILKDEESVKELIQQIKTVCEHENLVCDLNEKGGEILVCPEGKIEVSLMNHYACLKTVTSLVGAGYHAYICELFQKIIDQGPVYLAIDDECEYLEDHDFDRIRDNYFYGYLHLLLTNMKAMGEDEEATYAWDERSYLPLAKPGKVITPMGYIDPVEVAHLTIDEAADQFFIWNHLEKNAVFFRNSALSSLWNECLFETSPLSEAKMGVARMICEALEKSHELDMQLKQPQHEYELLCKLLNRKIKMQAENVYEEKIGYRRDHLLYAYGNWLIYETGYALQSFDGNTMILKRHDATSLEWQSTMKVTGYMSNTTINEFADSFVSRSDAIDEFEWQEENIRCKGMIYQCNDETSSTILQAQLLCKSETLMITMELTDLSQQERAMEQLHLICYLEASEKEETDVRI